MFFSPVGGQNIARTPSAEAVRMGFAWRHRTATQIGHAVGAPWGKLMNLEDGPAGSINKAGRQELKLE